MKSGDMFGVVEVNGCVYLSKKSRSVHTSRQYRFHLMC